MPAERSTKGKAGSSSRHSNDVEPCTICGKVVSRISDIPRHMKKHDSAAKKIPCPWEGCTFSALQKSNLDTHYRRHTQDRSFLCTDDPACTFQTCDPASLLRHRKRLHNYIPKSSGGRKTKPFNGPARRGRKASPDSSSVASPLSMNGDVSMESSPSSMESSPSPMESSPFSMESSPSPRESSPFSMESSPFSMESSPFSMESSPFSMESSPFSMESSPFSMESSPFSMESSPFSMESSPFSMESPPSFMESSSPCSYNFAWDSFPLPELDLLAAEPEMEQFDFQYPCQEESQVQMKNLCPSLQLPNVEQFLPGYGTTGQLHGSCGLSFGFEQPLQEASLLGMNDDAWFGLSVPPEFLDMSAEYLQALVDFSIVSAPA